MKPRTMLHNWDCNDCNRMTIRDTIFIFRINHRRYISVILWEILSWPLGF